ncbi:hypothetical protein [Algoriphagus sp. CAU 1675]|uniref:hypothetical protein n=1 Tax=Algoriphagus sp. CAU 1675 TaxID=3032597 RepID=UPI0023DACCE0|nr:hypothetical protein [Algoriphagus sp. CAU 1675]MDF2158783.1 hypothetical protein [Algoriphagus sp. CAU 1675]
MKALVFAFSLLLLVSACESSERDSILPGLSSLSIIDSLQVNENGFFLNGQGQVKIIGDSLIAVSSVRKPAIGLIDLKSGNQIAQITASDFPEAPFFPSSFDVSEFPILYIADRYTNSIFEFDALEGKFLKKTKLQIPEEKVVKAALGEFHKTSNGFLVELTTSQTDIFHPDYFRKSGNLIYLFDEKGDSIASFLKFPEILQTQERTINLEAPMESTFSNNSFIYSFPQEKKVKITKSEGSFDVISEIELPNSRYFDYGVKGFDKIISFDDLQNMNSTNFSNTHYFMSMRDTRSHIYIQTWLIGDESAGLNRTSHLLIWDKSTKKWSETNNPRNILDIGMLAGVVNDTIYFYEGSLMKHDEKYIKRAVLRPVAD